MAFTGFEEAVVLDTETTGLDPDQDRIVSLALCKVNFSDLRHNPKNLADGLEKEYVFDPGKPIPEGASRVHGIFDKDVEGKPRFDEKSKEIRGFIGKLPVIGHNVSFDKSMLSAELKRAGEKTLSRNKSYCTMTWFQEYNHGWRKGSTLGNATRWFGLPVGNCHDAMEDTRMAARPAAVFYMVDNKIKVPGGFPEAPSADQWFEFIREDVGKYKNGLSDKDNNLFTAILIVLVAIVIWWLFF